MQNYIMAAKYEILNRKPSHFFLEMSCSEEEIDKIPKRELKSSPSMQERSWQLTLPAERRGRGEP